MAKFKSDLAQRGRELRKKFEEASKTIESKADMHMFIAAKAIENTAVGLVPVDTSQLKNSIGIKKVVEGKKIRFKVGSLVEYARIIEYGGWTGKGHNTFIKPQPYLRPALQYNKEFILQKLRDAWRESID